MEHKHTPGPWMVAKVKAGIEMGDYVIALAADERGDRALLVYAKDGCDDQADANVRLMAAAPDLLAVAQAALPRLRGEYMELAQKYAGTPFEDDKAYRDVEARYFNTRDVIARATGTQP